MFQAIFVRPSVPGGPAGRRPSVPSILDTLAHIWACSHNLFVACGDLFSALCLHSSFSFAKPFRLFLLLSLFCFSSVPFFCLSGPLVTFGTVGFPKDEGNCMFLFAFCVLFFSYLPFCLLLVVCFSSKIGFLRGASASLLLLTNLSDSFRSICRTKFRGKLLLTSPNPLLKGLKPPTKPFRGLSRNHCIRTLKGQM